MEVLLIHPPSSFLLSSSTFPPLGLMYLAAALRRGGHTPVLVDMGCGDALAGHHPGCIGITATTAQLPELGAIIDQCRTLYPAVPILLGGPHFNSEKAMHDGPRWGVEGVGAGECEEVICRAVETVRFGEFNGIYRTEGYVSDVRQVGKPDRSLVDLHRYRYTLGNLPATTLIIQRGCPYNCAFCSRSEGVSVVRLRAISQIEDELIEIRNLGFPAVVFYDDEFNTYHGHCMQVAASLSQIGMRWRAFIRTNLFSEKQAKHFAECGCYELCAGVESGSAAILKKVRKGATPEDNSEARKLCADYGIRFKAFMLLGLPGENHETVELTRRWLLENRPDDFDLGIFQPYPGTHIAAHPEQYDIEFDLDYLTNPVWHKGTPGKYRTTVRTKDLSSEDLIRLRDEIETQVRQEIGLPKLGGRV